MKDNLNIEKLFKDKFENFEGNVSPDLWTNISKGIASNTAVSSGVGLGVKALIVGVSAVTVGVTAYFVGDFNQSTNQIADHTVTTIEVPVSIEEIKTEQNIENNTSTIIVADDNDPVITKNKAEIIKDLSNSEVVKAPNLITEDVTNNNVTLQPSLSEEVEATETETNTTAVQSDNQDNTVETNSVEAKESNEVNHITEEITEQVSPTGKIESSVTENIFEYEFRSNGQNVDEITWDFGDGNVSFDKNPSHTYSTVGEYQVELVMVGENGLVFKQTETIEINSMTSIDNIPNVMTPNGDRINDEFVIVEKTEISEFIITITDRQGKTVFKSNNQNFIWDGTDMSGNLCNKGIYTYYIIARGNDGTVLKIPGQLSLVR